ncbi:hypothetical protein BEL04_16755 [Mucilaginibacter sp. PPCGB 2223]|uniref:hypothetical protein n=1 Tax=Mucilaginibacter sp. PPCGB 2223 TaxID=1886027 RepID=UPI00082718A0|nr:hypothetical protein [Mucilaginibacter sp. PPCGB 2223]OCX51667.1 hypothetical protein BEL04_16755 [Mucilaginibacter sp. PPCGB 2223]
MEKPGFKLIFNIILVISILIIILTITSCKTNSGTPNYPVTEEDAAEIISNGVLSQFGGVLNHINNGVQFAQRPGCGVTCDTTTTLTAQPGPTSITAKNNLQWHYQLNCQDKSFTGTYTGSISYSGQHFSADNTCSGTLTCTPQQTPTYKIAFNFTIDGTDIKKTVDANTLKTNITMQGSDILVEKNSGTVTSGQIQVAIHISYYNYSGTVKFMGNRMASIVLNSGTSYSLSL